MIDIYENGTANTQISKEAVESWEVEKVEYEGGIKIYLKGCDFPQKGLPTPEAIFSINQIKKILLTSVKTFHVLLLLLPKQKLINAFNTVCWGIISPYTLKPEYRTDFTLEIGSFIYRFMVEYGIEKKSSERFANIISHIFEYDNAYRLRVQDMFTSSSDRQLFDNPRQELKRLLKLNRVREFKSKKIKYLPSTKFKIFHNLLSVALLSPKIKKCFKKALQGIDFTKLQFDKGDLYWALQRTDYDTYGLPLHARENMIQLNKWKTIKGKRV
jgi:hypothetical protein